MKRSNFPNRKEQKRKDAEARNAARAKLGDRAQLEKLNALFPNGANKEKARLTKRLGL